MNRYIHYIYFLLIFISCEEVYTAKLDVSQDRLVVEARVSNTPEKNRIKLSRTANFYEKIDYKIVTGATVFLIDKEGHRIHAADLLNGFYELDYAAVPGEHYKLSINVNGQDYESDFQIMPGKPKIEAFNLKADTVASYTYSTDGEPIKNIEKGVQVSLDLPLTDDLSHYYFESKMILQYKIFLGGLPPPPPIYGWKTFRDNSGFNIAGLPEYGETDILRGHNIGFNNINIDHYLSHDIMNIGIGPQMKGWIIIIDQYGIAKETYNFYKTINEQLEAEGKLFDPVFPQIRSNIYNKTNPNKKVIGYFELNSHQTRKYFYNASLSDTIDWYQFESDFEIPEEGQLQQSKYPHFWEYYGKRPLGALSDD